MRLCRGACSPATLYHHFTRPLCLLESTTTIGITTTTNNTSSCCFNNSFRLPAKPFQGNRQFHASHRRQFLPAQEKLDDAENKLIERQKKAYNEIDEKLRHRMTFVNAISNYIKVQSVHRRGHVEFIYASLDKMDDFKVNKDLSVYKEILELFPKEKMVPKNAWQVEMQHYPKQQQCCIDVLDKMEFNGVIPDDAMGYQLIKIFGDKSHVFRKYRRMMYWLPKFKYANPYHVPHILPTDKVALAVMALKRINVDLQHKITVYAKDTESFDDNFIVSCQSKSQRSLVDDHVRRYRRFQKNKDTLDPVRPLYVQGGYSIWLRGVQQYYFVLRSIDPSPLFNANRALCKDDLSKQQRTDNDFMNWSIFGDKRKSVLKSPSQHEQLDGTILATCITGTGSKDSLTMWIQHLEKICSSITDIPVLFMLKSRENAVVTMETEKNKNTSVI